MKHQSPGPSHSPTILILAAVVLAGLLGLPPCNKPGCGDLMCLFVKEDATVGVPMGFQSIDPQFIQSRQRQQEDKGMWLVIPKAKPAYLPHLDTLNDSLRD